MGMDQQACFAITNGDGSVREWRAFMHWRKDYQLHTLIGSLCSMSEHDGDCGWSAELTDREIDAIARAIESGELAAADDECGFLSWDDNGVVTYDDFVRLARLHLNNGKRINYFTNW